MIEPATLKELQAELVATQYWLRQFSKMAFGADARAVAQSMRRVIVLAKNTPPPSAPGDAAATVDQEGYDRYILANMPAIERLGEALATELDEIAAVQIGGA